MVARIAGANPEELKKSIQAYAEGREPPAPAAAEDPASPGPESVPAEEDQHERLSKLVQAKSVMLFMKGNPNSPQCGFSRQIVGLLRERGVKFGFFDILQDDDVRQGMKAFSEWPTYVMLCLHVPVY